MAPSPACEAGSRGWEQGDDCEGLQSGVARDASWGGWSLPGPQPRPDGRGLTRPTGQPVIGQERRIGIRSAGPEHPTQRLAHVIVKARPRGRADRPAPTSSLATSTRCCRVREARLALNNEPRKGLRSQGLPPASQAGSRNAAGAARRFSQPSTLALKGLTNRAMQAY